MMDRFTTSTRATTRAITRAITWAARRAAGRGGFILLVCIAAASWAPTSSYAVGQCGGQKDTCKCGKNNPYPCCSNGSNCTWWAWHEACCNWKIGLPGWGNANTWHSYAKNNPGFVVHGSPSVGSIATSTKGKYGHVAWVVGVGNGTVTVREMNCCGTCKWGMGTRVHKTSYFNSGFVRPKPKGPVCGNKKCEGGESCASCAKDCGSCCGNKKCDHGETCTSCAKDCVCLPKGSFEVAGSTTMRGWAQDPNAPSAKVSVEVRADGKKVATSPADQPHSKVKGHGFRVMTPLALCDAKPHSMTVVAVDTAGKGKPSLGKRALSCRSDEVLTGPYLTRYNRASSVAAEVGVAAPTPVTAPLARLRHVHPAGSPYALGGVVESCLTPGVKPFDAVQTAVSRAMGGLPLMTELRVDALPVATLKTDATVTLDTPLTAMTGGMQLCLRTWGTAEQVHSKGGAVTLAAPLFRRGGWWYGLEAEGHGLRIDLTAETDPALRGAATATGALRLWRPLTESFDHLWGRVVGVDEQSGIALLKSIDEPVGVALAGTFDLLRLRERDVLALRWTRAGSAKKGDTDQLAAAPFTALERVRISRNTTATLGMFHVQHDDSFGLHVAATPPTQAPTLPRDLGWRLSLSHRDGGWWSIGSVTASLALPGPSFDRIRLHVRGHHSVAGLQVLAATDAGSVVLPQPTAASGDRQLEIAIAGDELRLVWQLTEERWQAPDAEVGLSHITLCRGGWWTAPSPDARGLWDARTADGDVSLHLLGGDAKADQAAPPARGTWLLSRELTAPQQAVRFTLKQALPASSVRLRVLFDDTPVAVLETPTASEKPVQVAGKTFQRLGLMMQVKPGTAAVEGYAIFSDVEVRGVDGVWRRVDALPVVLAEALLPTDTVALADGATPVELDAAAGGEDVSAGESPTQPGGCGVVPVETTPAAAWLCVIALAAIILRRRRRRA